jgi:hypothetical protein
MSLRFAAACLLMLPALAFGWGAAGHSYTGAVADRLLKKSAAVQVKKIVGMPLATASLWADCVKDVGPAGKGAFRYTPHPQYHAPCIPFETKTGIARMESYVRRNWKACKQEAAEEACHRQYHYADVAIQRSKYDRAYRGTSEHDIVGAIDAAVLVLRGEPAPAPFSIRDKREALLLLAHFVGDLHQPLHVGAVYLDAKGKRIDPDVPGGAYGKEVETFGGNAVAVGESTLHGRWDDIPDDLDAKNITKEALARARAVPESPGDASTWPQDWATDSLHIARTAFSNVAFGAKQDGKWEARFAKGKDAYEANKELIQRNQLIKGGARLAQLLNEIWP